MLKLRLLTGPRAGRQLRVSDTKPVSIGRRKGRLRLHDSRVSKNHAEIYCANGVWILRDLGSANGTYVNRRRAKGLVELEPGDHVQMGRVLIKIVRCDMIGMDTQPFVPDDAVDGAMPALAPGAAEPSQVDDDFDLDDLLSDSQDDDLNDESSASFAIDTPGEAADHETVDADDDAMLEPMLTAFDEPVHDDDSFFADLGEATDTTGGDAIAIKGDSSASDVDIDLDNHAQSGANESLELAGHDAIQADADDASVDADEEADPFLLAEPEPTDDGTDDLISLGDESGMDPRNAGTTLLAAVPDDDMPTDMHEQNDAGTLDQDDEDQNDDADDEPPALVGLTLEHAPPQQPVLDDADDAMAETIEADDVSADDDETLDKFETCDESDAINDIATSMDGFDLPPGIKPPVHDSVDADAEVRDDEPTSQLNEATDQDTDFDIDAAFDALSAGLDDSMPGMPAIHDEATSEVPAEDIPAPTMPTPDATADPLVGSQLDVSFIKDALSRLEDEPANQQPPQDNEPTKASAAPTQSIAEPLETTPPPAPADDSYLHSPPPGLASSDMNPTSMNPPAEPFRSYAPKRKGGGAGRWFFTLLLFLGIGGVGGWFINQNYDRLVGSRTSTPPADTLLPNTPAVPNAPLAGLDQPPTPPIDPPAQPSITEDETPTERLGPNPFSSGPPVIGGDALQGLFRDSSDTRPLDPPRQDTPNTVTGSDPLRDPSLPSVGSTTPNLQKPEPDPPAVEPTPTVPAVTHDKPARIVFLVDASGSLVDSLPQMLTWLNEALRTIEQDEQFAVYFFKSDKPIAIKPAGMLKPSRSLLNAIANDWLNADQAPVFPSGRSNPAKAIAQALSLEPTDIYLLSDDAFAFHQGDTTASDALNLVKQAIGDKPVRVHGVQFFYRSDKSILETLANQYDGTFEFVRENVVPNADPIDLLEELGSE